MFVAAQSGGSNQRGEPDRAGRWPWDIEERVAWFCVEVKVVLRSAAVRTVISEKLAVGFGNFAEVGPRAEQACQLYRAGERIRDERTSEVYDHSDRDDVAHKEVVLPSDLVGRDEAAVGQRGLGSASCSHRGSRRWQPHRQTTPEMDANVSSEARS